MNTKPRRLTISEALYLLIVLWSAGLQGQEVVLISAESTIATKFMELTTDTPCKKITSFKSPHTTSRTVLELVFICQAFHLAGLDAKLVIRKMPNYSRALERAASGDVTMPAETLWGIDIDDTVFYKSEPIIRQGEMEQGIFTLPTRKDVLAIRSLEELRKFTAVSQKNWRVDWITLHKLGLRHVYSTAKVSNMFKMVKGGRADFLLWTFSSEEDMGQENGGIRLVPVSNVKIGMQGSRHFVISKKAPNAKKIFDALTKGIGILRGNGVITQAFTESGFFHAKTVHWKRISPIQENARKSSN